MAFDESLAKRVRANIGQENNVKERRMFGGLAFLVNGHMCCGVVGGDLVVRVGARAHQEALSQPHTRPMDFTGRPMKGFVYVAPPGVRSAVALRTWIKRGLRFVRSLPPK